MVELVTALEQAHRESPSWRLYGLCHQAATRIAELEAENAEQKERLIQFANAFDTGYAAAERALAERAGGVKVKALEWVKDNSVGGHGGWIGRAGDFTRAVKIGWMVEMPYEFGDQAFATLDDAKAAAQADYERRILSTLTTEPAAPEGRQEAVACIACEDKPAVPNDPCAVCGKSARPAEQAVTEAGKGLLRIVEEIDGAVNHGTWRDKSGMRLKDTPEWVAFYNALKAAMEAGR